MLKPRKRLVKERIEEDSILTYTAKSEKIIKAYWKRAGYVLAVIVIIFAVFTVQNMSKKNAGAEAEYEEMLARDAFSTNDFDEALKHINILVSDYSGTPAAASALMMQGRINQQRGEYEQASEAFKQIVGKHMDCQYLAFGAFVGLGTIEYGNGNFSKAADHYQAAVKNFPDHFNAPVALIEAGKCLEKISKYEEAKQVYNRILKQYPKSRSANSARDNLAELEFMS